MISNTKLLSVGVASLVVGVLGGYFIGDLTHEDSSNNQIIIANRSGIILQAILDTPEMNKDDAQKLIVTPINNVLKSYRDQGFVVLDAAKNEDGHYSIIALPENAKDITNEIKEAIKHVSK